MQHLTFPRRSLALLVALVGSLAACGGVEGEEGWEEYEEHSEGLVAIDHIEASAYEEGADAGSEEATIYVAGVGYVALSSVPAAANPMQARGDSSPDPIPARMTGTCPTANHTKEARAETSRDSGTQGTRTH